MGIQSANPGAIKKLVAQLFEYGKRIIAKGMVPILEPEVDITAKDKAEIEDLLLPELVAGLEKLGPEDKVIFQLSLPEKSNLYQPLMKFPQVVRVVALSGGFDLEESSKRLAENDGMVAGFSRTLHEVLHKSQTDEEFTKTLGDTLGEVTAASSTAEGKNKVAGFHWNIDLPVFVPRPKVIANLSDALEEFRAPEPNGQWEAVQEFLLPGEAKAQKAKVERGQGAKEEEECKVNAEAAVVVAQEMGVGTALK